MLTVQFGHPDGASVMTFSRMSSHSESVAKQWMAQEISQASSSHVLGFPTVSIVQSVQSYSLDCRKTQNVIDCWV